MARGNLVTYLLSTAHGKNINEHQLDVDSSWANETCPHCGHGHALVVAMQMDGNYTRNDSLTEWYRCVACSGGYVRQGGLVYPAARPLRTPLGLPADEATVWEEARGCLGLGANTAAVMLCRKLLLHIATTHGLPEKNDNGFAPGFAECVEHLKTSQLVTPRMVPWVERIKEIGNEANHKLVPVTTEQAVDVATFTEQLLILTYELDARMAAAKSTPDPVAETP